MHTNTCQGLHFMKQDSHVKILRILDHLKQDKQKCQ